MTRSVALVALISASFVYLFQSLKCNEAYSVSSVVLTFSWPTVSKRVTCCLVLFTVTLTSSERTVTILSPVSGIGSVVSARRSPFNFPPTPRIKLPLASRQQNLARSQYVGGGVGEEVIYAVINGNFY